MRPAARALGGRSALIALVLWLSAFGCSSPPGQRMLQDSFVFFTSPAQVPVMAARDAAQNHPDSTAATVVLFPINFSIFFLEHTVFSLVHLFDMPVAPYHYAVDSKPMDIYKTPAFPMKLDKTAKETLESGVAAGALVVGAVALGILLTAALL